MTNAESVRIEIAFEGGLITSAIVAPEGADAVERALAAGSQGTLQLDTDDGRITVSLSRVAWVKRYAREAKVGFGI